MRASNAKGCRRQSPLWLAIAATAAALTTGATLPAETPVRFNSLELADITIKVPVVIPGYPVIVVPRREVERDREVIVRFVAQGNDWATIYLDGRLVFRASNTRRDYAVRLEPGAYYLEVTGVTQFDSWGSGYLDVGRDDANVLVVRYDKEAGIQVVGDPYAWFPD